MAKDEEYQQRAATMKRRELNRLWAQIQTKKTPRWDPGKAFEYLLLRAFQLEGLLVRWPFTVPMEGRVVEQIDGTVYLDGLGFLVQAKDHRDNVDMGPVCALRSQLGRRPATAFGLLFSASDFTPAAMVLVKYQSPLSVLLWRGEEVEFGLGHKKMAKGLHAKYAHAIEDGVPDFDIRELR